MHSCYVTRERNNGIVVDLKFIYGHTDHRSGTQFFSSILYTDFSYGKYELFVSVCILNSL